MWVYVLTLSSIGIAMVWLKTGSLQSAFVVNGFLLPFVLFAGYFATRSATASSTEKRLARAWIIMRRLICFTAALVLGLIAVCGFVLGFKSRDLGAFAFGAFFGLLAIFSAWTGAYGAGNRRAFSDDKPTHEERKARYGWK
jgi:hypothetical protein